MSLFVENNANKSNPHRMTKLVRRRKNTWSFEDWLELGGVAGWSLKREV